jgi:hypothetical protein
MRALSSLQDRLTEEQGLGAGSPNCAHFGWSWNDQERLSATLAHSEAQVKVQHNAAPLALFLPFFFSIPKHCGILFLLAQWRIHIQFSIYHISHVR